MKSVLASALCAISLLSGEPALAGAPTLANALGSGTIASSCVVGSYRLADGSIIDIAPDDDKTLDWRALNGEMGELHRGKDGSWTGTSGWTDRPDGKTVSFTACNKGGIVFGGKKGQRIPFDVADTTFQSDGVKLVGKLIMPPGRGKIPIVILVHGAEASSEIDTNALQRIFPAQGIGAFVFDKRGTARSTGVYTQDYQVLAGDVVNAMHEARRLAGARAGRIGYQGGSQGGWVVPIAVNREPVDFAIVSFGLAVNVIEEDQEGVALDMSFHHHSAEDTKKALELAAAGEHVVATLGKDGYAQFDALRQRYKSEPWYKDVQGDYIGLFMPLDQKKIIEALKPLAATPFHYDPMPALRASATPQLWILGKDDLQAPSAETSKRIKSLIASGRDYTLALYPGAQHGMTLYKLDAKGARLSTRYAPRYFQMMADFIKNGRIGDRYGNAEITHAPKH
jgi:hypothetical protein